MKLISENIHIISKQTREAIITRDESWIRNLLKKLSMTSPDWIDLNIGPAKKNFEGTMKWLTEIVQDVCEIPISFDSSNVSEIKEGLLIAKNKANCIINSTSADTEKLEKMTDLAAEFGSYLVALTLNSDSGIPKFADKRLELAFYIIEKCSEKNISNEKIIFDPLILPVCVDQTQVPEALNTIRMIKESFEPQPLTTIGLSNVSNGVPKELRPLINQVFFVLAAGCGLDTAIIDSFDTEILRLNNVLETQKADRTYDKLIMDLYSMQQNFCDLDEISYNTSSDAETKIFKTAEILLNKKVYNHSYLEIN